VRYLALGEVLALHEQVLQQTGGAGGLRDLAALESAIAQPRATFGGHELYPDLLTKATALAYSLIRNHPFVDGNKRVGHAALETFLMLNHHELDAPIDEMESMILGVAAGTASRAQLQAWIQRFTRPLAP